MYEGAPWAVERTTADGPLGLVVLLVLVFIVVKSRASQKQKAKQKPSSLKRPKRFMGTSKALRKKRIRQRKESFARVGRDRKKR